MREILFRGKRVDNGEWVYGNLIQYDGENFIMTDEEIRKKLDHFLFMYGVKMYRVITGTIGQYTSRTDKNGNKIFEGDICRSEFSLLIALFYEDEESMRWHVTGAVYGIPLKYHEDIEVIGNIHDNPELLEGDDV